MAKFCTQCGSQNPEGAIFCAGCGMKQGAISAQPVSSPQQPQYPTQPATGMSDTALALITVLGSLCVVPIIFPLVMWLAQRNQNKKIEETAKEVLNFQVTFLAGLIAAMIALFILSFVGGMMSRGIGAFIGVTLMGFTYFIFAIAYLVLMVKSAIQASKNEIYRFPFTVRLIR